MTKLTKRQKRKKKITARIKKRVTEINQTNYIINKLYQTSLINESEKENNIAIPLGDVWLGFIEDPEKIDIFMDLNTACSIWQPSTPLNTSQAQDFRPFDWYITFNKEISGPFPTCEDAFAYSKLKHGNTIFRRQKDWSTTTESPDYMQIINQPYSSLSSWETTVRELYKKHGLDYDPLFLFEDYRFCLAEQHADNVYLRDLLLKDDVREHEVIDALNYCNLTEDAARLEVVFKQHMDE